MAGRKDEWLKGGKGRRENTQVGPLSSPGHHCLPCVTGACHPGDGDLPSSREGTVAGLAYDMGAQLPHFPRLSALFYTFPYHCHEHSLSAERKRRPKNAECTRIHREGAERAMPEFPHTQGDLGTREELVTSLGQRPWGEPLISAE